MRLSNTLTSLVLAGSLAGCGNDSKPTISTMVSSEEDHSVKKPVEYTVLEGVPLSCEAIYESKYGYGRLIIVMKGDKDSSRGINIAEYNPVSRNDREIALAKALIDSEINDGDDETILIETNVEKNSLGDFSYGIEKIIVQGRHLDFK